MPHIIDIGNCWCEYYDEDDYKHNKAYKLVFHEGTDKIQAIPINDNVAKNDT